MIHNFAKLRSAVFRKIERSGIAQSRSFCEIAKRGKRVGCDEPPQHQKLIKIAEQAGFNLHKSEDFIQIFVAS